MRQSKENVIIKYWGLWKYWWYNEPLYLSTSNVTSMHKYRLLLLLNYIPEKLQIANLHLRVEVKFVFLSCYLQFIPVLWSSNSQKTKHQSLFCIFHFQLPHHRVVHIYFHNFSIAKPDYIISEILSMPRCCHDAVTKISKALSIYSE